MDPKGVPAMVNDNAFKPEFLDNIISEFKDQVGVAKHLDVDNKGVMSSDNKVRNSDVVFFRNPELQSVLWDIVRAANNMMGYNMDLTGAEDPQFTKYGPKQHYYWHQDQAIGCPGRKFIPNVDMIPKNGNPMEFIPDVNLIGTVRKMSITLLLNDPKEYKGGEFEMAYTYRGKLIRKKVKGKKGTVIIFPSWIEHRVIPVKEGTRYSIVQWFAGAPWK
jgi:PKHD-type hydroxylase